MKQGLSFISCIESPVLKPGIASSLSMVPPVCASPLPANIGTVAPAARNAGARIMLILSPTPPVECLSTRPCKASILSPAFNIARVKSLVS